MSKKVFDFFIKKRHKYVTLDKDDKSHRNKEYYKNYGVNDYGKNYEIADRQKLKIAFQKAWEIRNFEIERYWQRTAYFWGFIALIFTGYLSVTGAKSNGHHVMKYLDFYLVSLGLIFSIGWLLVLIGSKTWQVNWETHVDRLEEFVSGPLYRIVYYRGRMFYSVSKINEVLAGAVIIVWLGLFIQYLSVYIPCFVSSRKINWPVTITTGLVFLFVIILIFGYPVGKYKSQKNKFFDRWEKYKKGEKK